MIARSFKPVFWVAGIGVAALACYMVSLKVASERAELAGLDRRIIAAREQIRDLQTELGTRGRLQQLEQWNAEVLALSAPVSGQYVENEVVLARFDRRQPVAAPEAEVRMASAPAAPATRAPVSAAQVETAAASATPTTPAPQRAVAERTAERAPVATVQQASLTVIPEAAPRRARREAAPPPAALLDESALRDIASRSRRERAGGARN